MYINKKKWKYINLSNFILKYGQIIFEILIPHFEFKIPKYCIFLIFLIFFFFLYLSYNVQIYLVKIQHQMDDCATLKAWINY
jgi:hypothetical protein